MKGYVYILQDEAGRFYVGSTNNVSRRLRHHALGHTQTTARMQAPRLALTQEYASLSIARNIETRIKKLKRKDYIEKMVQEGEIRLK